MNHPVEVKETITPSLYNSFPAFQNKNYRLYFTGQLISLVGTWLQIVAQGWLVLQLTTSPIVIGMVAALSSLPTFFLTLFGGVIVDRFPKKRILIYTQCAAMFLAFLLGVLTLLDVVEIWHIATLAFALGIIQAIDSPARQSFVSEVVTKDQLASAIAINSGVFNAARVIGPGVAGLLIAWVGTGGAFLINGLSYIAVIVALFKMKMVMEKIKDQKPALEAIKEGIFYAISHPIIRNLLLFTGISSIFGWSYTTVIPLITQKDFHMESAGLGYMYAATGLGSVLATIIVATTSKRISPMVFILGGNAIFSVSVTLFTYTNNLWYALPLLFLCGFGLLSQFAMMNTVIQRLVKSEVRGRVMSIYIFMFMGLSPIGSFLVGYISEHYNTDVAIRLGAFVVFIFGTILFYYKNRIIASYKEYKESQL